MKRAILIRVILLCLTLSAGAQNYPYKYYFRNISRHEGLSQTDIKAILQDNRGFMWFGTRNRLNRYDGHTIRVFDCYDAKAGKRNNNISSLYEDSAQRLWVGTDKGVFLLDSHTERFTFVSAKTPSGVQMVDWVAAINSDRDGNIWIVVPNQGVFRFGKDGKLSLFTFGQPGHADSGGPQCLCIDAGGRVWVGTNGNGAYLFQKNANRFEQYLGDRDGGTLAHENIYSICDYGDELVLGIHEGKLRRLNKLRNTVSDFNAPEVHYSIIRDVKCYDEQLWIGTQRGVYVINEQEGTLQHIEHDAMCIYSLSDNQIGRIYRDREGGIWIGTNLGGVNYLPQKGMGFMRYVPLTKPYTISSKRVREMAEDAQGNIWIGTEDAGINIFDPEQGTFKVLGKELGGRPTSEKTLALKAIEGNMWIGFFKDALDIVAQNGLNVRHYSGEQLGLNESSLYAIYHDSQGRMWLGNGWGVYMAPSGSMEFKRMDIFGYNYIFDITEDSDHNIWVITMGNGVYRYNPSTGKLKHYTHRESDPKSLSSNSVSNITETSRGELWFSTDRGGVCRFNPADESFTTFSFEQGLPDDTGYKILEDKQGNLWFGTNNGLVSLDPATGKCRVFTTAHGLPGNQFNYKSALSTSNGIFYFGSSEGLISFDPDNDNRNLYAPPVYITRFFINNTEVFAGGEDSPLSESIISTRRITLRHDQSNIAFEFSALSYVMPSANQYAYKMDGVDNDWIYTDNNQSVSYANLSPGRYVFHVKGSNSDGVWCEHEASIEIVVLPPWWKSFWAYLLYLSALIAAVWWAFRIWTNHEQEKADEAKRLFEAEKERELYRDKIDFFTSIAHEIRTPLTLINGPLENLEDMDIADPEITSNLHTMRSNTSDLMNLINQLLDFRKMDSNMMDMFPVSVDLSTLLDEWINKFAAQPMAANHSLQLTAPDEHIFALADRNALIKVLNNLFSNAVKYGEQVINVYLTADDRQARVTIDNDGDIIPEAEREKIFDPFYQLKKNANASSSSGIGLYLARSMAEQMHGTLTYSVHEGMNRFALCLPTPVKTEAAPPTPDEEAMLTDDNDLVPDRLQSAIILIVEDNEQLQQFIADKLRLTYGVETAGNGKEALEVLNNMNIDLVLSDIMMPEMDGLELCRHIKENIELSHIPVILITSKNDLDSKVQGLQMGADAYIEKPFSYKYLIAQITSIFENRRRNMDAFMRKPFVPTQTLGMSKADQQLMDRIVQVIEENIDDTNFGVEMLAELVCMSRSSLHRKIKAISDSSPTDFIKMVRLKKASELIAEGSYRVMEVCYMVGFNSPSYFIKLFQKQFGMTPKEFERQQRKAREENLRSENENDNTQQ